MGLIWRRFLNLLVNEHTPGVKSLRFIDLKRQRLFYPDTPPPTASSTTTTRLPKPSFTFRPADSDASDEWRIHCFPLGVGRSVVCADQSGRVFAVDADACVAGTMPSIKPKRMPLALSIPRPVDDDECCDDTGSSLLVMERFPKYSDKFEALVNRRHSFTSINKTWHRDDLPLPPFVRKNSKNQHEITACAVVGGGSDICISAEGAGTYRMPWLGTKSHEWTWTQVGDWTLPFYGKAEFVPELNLWFGLSADTKALAAADLSAMDSRPQLVAGPWNDGAAPSEECQQDAQLVNLGSGRFCIARFFGPAVTDTDGDSGGDESAADKSFVVLTGVEVAGGGNGNGGMEIQMVKHMSRRLNNTDGATIEAVF
ncbi:unnamed protein product [Urochloa decumbens]|uniref:Uncharacterized protein n=1 Tax=Urochloa decumbens TaxID=240449 RepID=A0ABC9FXV9_9POAL